MKLKHVRITDFQSIQDSTQFDIDDVTCLVGKNEAGKTAILKALYRLKPIVENHGNFDSTDDYPRRAVSEYEDSVESSRRDHATVVRATYCLEPDDVSSVEQAFGPDCLVGESPCITLRKGYGNQLSHDDLNVNVPAALRYLISAADLPQTLAQDLGQNESPKELLNAIRSAGQADAAHSLTQTLDKIEQHGLCELIYAEILESRIPKFLYFDEYYQLKGQDNLDALRQRQQNKALEDSDHPLIGLISLAGLRLDQLLQPRRTEQLLARLEAAENRLTDKVLRYWSQNRHLRMKFDVRSAKPEDGRGMTSGTNIWGRVHDTKHMVSTALGTRSRGFVWFFSFLAWYSDLRTKGENLILLLDEPGLSLHAKAQGDLLRYFEKDLAQHHQLIYTTHSPFMVDPTHFDRVRIIQDRSLDDEDLSLPEDQEGTRVTTDVLEATPDSLFPLQGALGYEIHQSLFIGPNCLIVEGVSDFLYIQSISNLLQGQDRPGLSSAWTVTPVGGSGNIPAFVALIGAQCGLNVAVLVDYHTRDEQKIENLYKSRLLRRQKVLTFAEYVDQNEADIEDMFEPRFYLDLVNSEFGSAITLDQLDSSKPRILRRIEAWLKNSSMPNNASFNHYRPARYFSENSASLGQELDEASLARFQRAFDALNKLL